MDLVDGAPACAMHLMEPVGYLWSPWLLVKPFDDAFGDLDDEMDGIHGTLVLVNEPLIMYVEPMMNHSVVELMSIWTMVSPHHSLLDMAIKTNTSTQHM